MITKNDCLLLLAEISSKDVDTEPYVQKVIKNKNIDLDVLRFINNYRPIELTLFYEFLRKRYNDKKSKSSY